MTPSHKDFLEEQAIEGKIVDFMKNCWNCNDFHSFGIETKEVEKGKLFVLKLKPVVCCNQNKERRNRLFQTYEISQRKCMGWVSDGTDGKNCCNCDFFSGLSWKFEAKVENVIDHIALEPQIVVMCGKIKRTFQEICSFGENYCTEWKSKGVYLEEV